MMRAWRLLATVALVSVSTALTLPADGSAFRGVGIALTADGPSPTVQTIPAGMYPDWFNADSVAHTVVFANGSCSFQLAPGAAGGCSNNGFVGRLGSYPYTVDGTAQASIVVTAEPRSITLGAISHTVARGEGLTLHGELGIPILSPPAPPAPQPVIVLARPDRYHAFHRVKVVMATTHGWHLHWQFRVGPRARTIYIVEANYQPKGGEYWERAWSKAFRVAVRPR